MAPSSVKMELSEDDLEPGISIIPASEATPSRISGGLEEPLIRKRSGMALGSFHKNRNKHTAIIGTNVSHIESLDYE